MGGENSALPPQSYATDKSVGAAVCKHYSSLQQIFWHTNIMGGENSALPTPSGATDKNDGAAVCKHCLSLQQIVGIPMRKAVAPLPPQATLLTAQLNSKTKKMRDLY